MPYAGQTNLVGQRLGSYRLVRRLGTGGFADVYQGEHVHLGSEAAIKVLLRTRFDPSSLRKFKREARIISRLRHRHIVNLLEFGSERNLPFLVMDLASGGTLRQRHPSGSIVEPNRVYRYLAQIGQALDFAHEARIVHRDVKPENMLLGQDGRLLLSDFGMVAIHPSSDLASSSPSARGEEAAGTTPYMAPEQLLGQPCAASDLYSLGIVVYEWLCGERPFRGNEAEVVAGHLKSAPPSLRAHNPRVSPLLEEVVMIALSKEPDQRYPSARDFANAFKMALEDKRPTVPLPALTLPASNGHTPTKPASTGKSSRLSRRTVLTAVAGGVLVAGAAGGLAWYASTQFQSRAGGTTVPTTTATKVPPGTTLQIYRGHQDVVNTVAWSPDGSYIVSGGDDKVARVWDAATGKDRFLYHQHADVVSSIACSPDSLSIVSGSYDGTTQVWSAKDGKRSNLQSYAAQKITSVAWSPNRDRAAYAGAGGKVILFEAPSGKEVLHYASQANYTYAIAFSPDGTMVAIGSGGTDEPVQVWNIVNNRKLISYSLNANPVYAVAWSPDGKLIASGGYDKTVHVWKVATGESVFKYQEHQDVVNAIAWSGEVLASGSNDGVIKLWNAANGATLSTFSEHTGAVRSIFWSPDGTRVASASADKTVRVWQVG